MFAALLLAPQIAFLLLAGLVVGAAVPLAMGWARLLPEERPPFEIENPRRRSPSPAASIYSNEPEERRLDPGAIMLLVLLTVAFAAQFPGVPRMDALNSLPDHLPKAEEWFEIALPCLLLLVCVIAILYGALRRSFLRVQLVVAGSVVLLLWVMGPWLYEVLTRV
jgi:hypothetical protein